MLGLEQIDFRSATAISVARTWVVLTWAGARAGQITGLGGGQ